MLKLSCFSASDQVETQTAADELPTIDHHPDTHPVEAWKEGKLTIGWSGGGFLLPYFLGVYQSLAAMGIAHVGIPMAGSSAGSLVVGSIKSGLTVQQQFESFLEAGHNCRSDGVNGRLRRVLKAQLQKWLPADAAQRCSDGTCWVSITQVIPRPCNKLYGGFVDKQALIRALLASCHLPRISDGGLFTYYKSPHKRVFDGGFSNLIPVPPAPPPALTTPSMFAELPLENSSNTSSSDGGGSSSSTSAAAPTPVERAARSIGSEVLSNAAGSAAAHATELRRSAAAAAAAHNKHSSSLKGIRLGFGAARHHSSSSGHNHHLRIGSKSQSSGSRLFRRSKSASDVSAAAAINSSSSSAASEHTVDTASCLVSATSAYTAPSAAGWFSVRVSVLPAKHMQQMPAMFNAPTAEGIAIAPDKYQDWPYDLDQTTKLALYPQDDAFLWDLFERGRADGVSWARDVGFPAEVLQAVEGVTSDSKRLPDALRVVRHQLPQQLQKQQRGKKGAKHTQQEQETAELAAVGDAEARAAVSVAAAAAGSAGAAADAAADG